LLAVKIASKYLSFAKIEGNFMDYKKNINKDKDEQSSIFTDGLKTARLLLRQPTEADILILRNLWLDKIVRQFLGGIILKEMIDEKIGSLQEHWNKYGFGECTVLDKSNNQVIGLCGLHHSDEDGIEISYMFFPRFWGNGFAKEAVLANLDFGFNVLKLNKIVAITQEANQGSCCLLTSIGMHLVKKFERFNVMQCLFELRSL
jgi:ribosomal-protein-alanine N-acetyltransferase